MTAFKFEFKGMPELKTRVGRFADNAAFSIGRELYREAEGMMTEAKLETPVDTGALRSSAYVSLPVIDGNRVAVDLGFGGPAAPYAVYVHENLQARHPVGKAKYLEDPFNRRAKEFLARMGGGVTGSFHTIVK